MQRSGHLVRVHYRGGIQGEEPVDDCSAGEPEAIRLGTGQMPMGFEEAIYDMEVGEKRSVTIPPEKAFGDYDPKGKAVYMRNQIPGGKDLKAGSVVSWRNPVSGRFIPVRVTRASQDYLEMDFNHPFAGKTLEYDIELVGVE